MKVKPISVNAEVEGLLKSAGLPVSDLHGARTLQFFGFRIKGRLAGTVGIENYGSIGLLRSVVVHDSQRGKGLGRALVSAAESWAAREGIRTLYLLTTTAADYFAGSGYETLPRDAAPPAIAATAQFSELCPASSTFLRKVLETPTHSALGLTSS